MTVNVGEEFVLLMSGPAPAGTELATRQVPAGDTEVRVGIDREGFRHLLVQVPDELPPGRQSAALSLGSRVLGVGGDAIPFADLKCMDTRLALVFERLVADVVARIEGGAQPDKALPLALNEWRDLFRSGSSGPTAEQVVGLVGELQVLERLSRSIGIERALEAWWGPDGHPHDFYSTEARAIEVKTTRSLEGNRIHISNVAQLDPAGLSDLRLVVFRLKQDRQAPTLDERINSLLERGFPAAALLTKIENAGYLYETPVPLKTRFAIVSETWWTVGDGFPGLRESRLSPAALRGVSNIKYELSLDAVGPSMSPTAVEELMGAWRENG
jgi:hypothetical protein